MTMTMERSLRFFAGTFVLASLLLGTLVHPGWFWLTAFVGFNLFQSAFTNWCPLIALLKVLGMPTAAPDR